MAITARTTIKQKWPQDGLTKQTIFRVVRGVGGRRKDTSHNCDIKAWQEDESWLQIFF
jgi:hypothetical protein